MPLNKYYNNISIGRNKRTYILLSFENTSTIYFRLNTIKS